jgi:hypothetical protein
MKKVILSCQIAEKFREITGIDVISLAPYKKLDTPVCSHPDMLVFIIDKTVFCYAEYYDLNENSFIEMAKYGYKIVKIEKTCAPNYPNDISLNALNVGRFIFGKQKHLAKEIVDYAMENGYELVNVKQGYAACSTLVLDEKNVITGDKTIENAAKSVGINALLISNENIILHGYNCGFIGGASVVDNDTVYFFGDVNTLDEYEKIEEIISSIKMKVKPILSGRVFDFGGGKVINE